MNGSGPPGGGNYARGGGESGTGASEIADGEIAGAASSAPTGNGMSITAGRMPTVPKNAMNPVSVCEHPIVGQSQSCVP